MRNVCLKSPGNGNEKEKESVGTTVGVDINDGVDIDFCVVEIGFDFSRL